MSGIRGTHPESDMPGPATKRQRSALAAPGAPVYPDEVRRWPPPLRHPVASTIHARGASLRALTIRMIAMLLRALASVLLFAALLPAPAVLAADSSTLHLSGAWARPMPPGARVGGGYVEIHNAGETTRRLLGAESPRASSMEIHTMAEVDGVMRMRRLPDGIEIPAGAKISLKPGAEHLMFFNPEPAFAEGETIPVTLRFDGETSITVEFEVADRSGKPADTHAGH